MGLFSRILYQSQGAKTAKKAFINKKILSYIIDEV